MEEGCERKFIRDYLGKHLQNVHRYYKADAITAALYVSDGDKYKDDNDDKSDDDTVFDLMEDLDQILVILLKSVILLKLSMNLEIM